MFLSKEGKQSKNLNKACKQSSVDSSGQKKTFQVSKYVKICQNHLEYGRQVETAPSPNLSLNVYDDDVKVGLRRKAPTSRKEPPARKKY